MNIEFIVHHKIQVRVWVFTEFLLSFHYLCSGQQNVALSSADWSLWSQDDCGRFSVPSDSDDPRGLRHQEEEEKGGAAGPWLEPRRGVPGPVPALAQSEVHLALLPQAGDLAQTGSHSLQEHLHQNILKNFSHHSLHRAQRQADGRLQQDHWDSAESLPPRGGPRSDWWADCGRSRHHLHDWEPHGSGEAQPGPRLETSGHFLLKHFVY